MMVIEGVLPLARAAALGPLRPCPFCGGAAVVEPSPWLRESVRIACGNEACRVTPRTEYLLLGFADELCTAWNGRAAPADPRPEAARD
jgi:hypothetical protein